MLNEIQRQQKYFVVDYLLLGTIIICCKFITAITTKSFVAIHHVLTTKIHMSPILIYLLQIHFVAKIIIFGNKIFRCHFQFCCKIYMMLTQQRTSLSNGILRLQKIIVVEKLIFRYKILILLLKGHYLQQN